MKLIAIGVCLASSFLSFAIAQDQNKPPTVKTFWTVPSNNAKYDIQFTPAAQGLKGDLRWVGPRCVVDQEVDLRSDAEGLVAEIAAMKPLAQVDASFCNRKIVVTFPTKKGFLGSYQGKIFIEGGKGSGLQDSTYFFNY